MAIDDFAILTGISRYANAGFSALESPLNDVRLMRDWLIADTGGQVPSDRIVTILSDPHADHTDAYDAKPNYDSFNRVFLRMLEERLKLGSKRASAGRLYLYFSGHGFSNSSQNAESEAAVYCANASYINHESIFGTNFARIAKAWALFKEIVLVMDCCRDSLQGRTPFPPPYLNSPDDDLERKVSMLTIYAAPRGLQTPEMYIAERDAVHGVLTHALLKVIEETAAPDARGMSGSELRVNLLASWTSMVGSPSVAKPEISASGPAEILFQARQRSNAVAFTWNDEPAGATLSITDSEFTALLDVDLQSGHLLRQSGDPSVISASSGPGKLELGLKSGLYVYQVNGNRGVQKVFQVPGGPSVHVL